MTTLVEGKKIALKIRKELEQKVTDCHQQLFFHIVYVGTDPVIENYLSYKKKFAEAIGVQVIIHRFSEDCSQEELTTDIRTIAEHEQPMIIQLPLPKHLEVQSLLNEVPASLDVDVLSEDARKKYAQGEGVVVPPVVGSIIEVFKHYNINLNNTNIVVIGEGMLVGKPIILWLTTHGCDYRVITQDTSDILKKELLANADIIISGAGVPGLVTADEVKQGVVVIDAGTSESGSRIVGDIDVSVQEKSSLFTPVPGGIGPLTIAILYRNVIDSYLYV